MRSAPSGAPPPRTALGRLAGHRAAPAGPVPRTSILASIRVTVGHYENFPVASRLVPAALRPAVVAIYRFARGADDLADEGDAPPGAAPRRARRPTRHALDADRARAQRRRPALPAARRRDSRAPAALAPFRELLSAFSQDVTVGRYATYDDLLDYCRRSANPVGRLLLALYRADEARRQRTSRPATRSARDCSSPTSGRTSRSTGARIASTCRRRISTASASRVAHIAAGRADDALARADGVPDGARARAAAVGPAARCARLPWRLGLELSAVIAGGTRILDRIDAVGGDVFRRRPVLRSARLVRRRAAHAAASRARRRRGARMTPDEYCQQKAAQSGSSFYYSFLFLPPERRRAITALYAFCREVDDVVDEVHDPASRTPSSRGGGSEIGRVFAGAPQHPVGKALLPVVRSFALPAEHFETVIDGMAMDLDADALPRLRGARALLPSRRRRRRPHVGGDLRLHRSGARAATRATSASRSSSPTSAATWARTRGAIASTCRTRISRASASRAQLAAARRVHATDFRELMAFEVERAQAWYDRALAQLPAGDRAPQRAGLVMAAIYRTLLDEIARDGYLRARPADVAHAACASCGSRGRRAAPVAIIGGGYAGCAAAVTLAAAGVRCVLYEAAPVLGGRAQARRARRPRARQRPASAARRVRANARAGAPGRAGRDAAPASSAVARALRRRSPARRDRRSSRAGRRGDSASPSASSPPAGSRCASAWPTSRGFARSSAAASRALADETVAAMLKPLPANVARAAVGAAVSRGAQHAGAQLRRRRSSPTCCAPRSQATAADSDFVLPTTDLSTFFPAAAERFVGRAAAGSCTWGSAHASSPMRRTTC